MATVSLGIGNFGRGALKTFYEQIAAETDSLGMEDDESDAEFFPPPSFFSEALCGPVPRAIFADLDASVKLPPSSPIVRFDPSDVHFGSEAISHSNYAHAFLSPASVALTLAVSDSIRRQAEDSDLSIDRLQIFHGLGGGTGSGLTSALLEVIRDEFPTTDVVCHTLFPSSWEGSGGGMESVNVVLSVESLLNRADTVLLYDNAALRAVRDRSTTSRLGKRTSTSHVHAAASPGPPSLADLNGLVAQAAAALSAPQRFAVDPQLTGPTETPTGPLALETLSPLPALHFLSPALAPVATAPEAPFQRGTADALIAAMTRPGPGAYLTSAGPTAQGRRFMAAGGIFRGGITAAEATEAAFKLCVRNGALFAPGAGGAFAVAVSGPAPPTLASAPGYAGPSALLLANSTAAAVPFRTAGLAFAQAFKARAGMHWLEREGLDREDLKEAYGRCSDLVAAYDDLEGGLEGEEGEAEAAVASTSAVQSNGAGVNAYVGLGLDGMGPGGGGAAYAYGTGMTNASPTGDSGWPEGPGGPKTPGPGAV